MYGTRKSSLVFQNDWRDDENTLKLQHFFFFFGSIVAGTKDAIYTQQVIRLLWLSHCFEPANDEHNKYTRFVYQIPRSISLKALHYTINKYLHLLTHNPPSVIEVKLSMARKATRHVEIVFDQTKIRSCGPPDSADQWPQWVSRFNWNELNITCRGDSRCYFASTKHDNNDRGQPTDRHFEQYQTELLIPAARSSFY